MSESLPIVKNPTQKNIWSELGKRQAKVQNLVKNGFWTKLFGQLTDNNGFRNVSSQKIWDGLSYPRVSINEADLGNTTDSASRLSQ